MSSFSKDSTRGRSDENDAGAGGVRCARPEGPADYSPRIFTNLPVATYGVALNPNSSSARKPVTFWSKL